MDVRAKKSVPVAQSEDQEDELLSIVAIKGFVIMSFASQIMSWRSYHRDTKIVVGTQLGMLSVFNRSSGWGDCVDRIPGFVDSPCKQL